MKTLTDADRVREVADELDAMAARGEGLILAGKGTYVLADLLRRVARASEENWRYYLTAAEEIKELNQEIEELTKHGDEES